MISQNLKNDLTAGKGGKRVIQVRAVIDREDLRQITWSQSMSPLFQILIRCVLWGPLFIVESFERDY